MEFIISTLRSSNFYDGDHNIQMAKGRYELLDGRYDRFKKFIRLIKVYIQQKRLKKQIENGRRRYK